MSSLTPQPLLITGATGCVGSQVCLRAQALGLPLRGLVRLSSEADWLRRLDIPVVTADLASFDPLAAAIAGVTQVVHCAARLGIGSPLDYRQLHVEGLRRLLNALAQEGCVRQFVLLSSLGVHALRDHHGTDETVSPAEQGLGDCLESLVEAEGLALDWGTAHGVAVTVLRPGLIYGPRERWVLPQLLRRLRDEAHRFAVSFHRQQRGERMKRSRLSDIPGMGPKRIKELLAHFRSIDAIQLASVETLAAAPGMGPGMAKVVWEYFHPQELEAPPELENEPTLELAG